ncbi:hypothetical protein GCM10007885_05800 [Methylobacterium gnaphalii]|nr:hypothetical protein GCM10007885_05800 [Methylobacterium gnaphalii]
MSLFIFSSDGRPLDLARDFGCWALPSLPAMKAAAAMYTTIGDSMGQINPPVDDKKNLIRGSHEIDQI